MRFFSKVKNQKGQPVSEGGRYLPNAPKLRELRPGVFAGYLTSANKLWAELLSRGVLTEESAMREVAIVDLVKELGLQKNTWKLLKEHGSLTTGKVK